VISATANAKINLALAVGPRRFDGLHEVATILQRVELADTIHLEEAAQLQVDGFADDTLVRRALELVAAEAGVEPCWRARIEKHIPVAGGLGGGSSDAAAALELACRLLDEPPAPGRLREIARSLGADVPFFLDHGPQLGLGDGAELEPVELPQDYAVLLLLPTGERKPSTAEIYGRFEGEAGFEERRARVVEVARAGAAADLVALPPNDLARSWFAERLRELGAFRADVSGAGPTVYGLFREEGSAAGAATVLAGAGATWLTRPAW
jgi:4-diphosphocytidyl-2-C-methyl-D-erythritol kinase